MKLRINFNQLTEFPRRRKRDEPLFTTPHKRNTRKKGKAHAPGKHALRRGHGFN